MKLLTSGQTENFKTNKNICLEIYRKMAPQHNVSSDGECGACLQESNTTQWPMHILTSSSKKPIECVFSLTESTRGKDDEAETTMNLKLVSLQGFDSYQGANEEELNGNLFSQDERQQLPMLTNPIDVSLAEKEKTFALPQTLSGNKRTHQIKQLYLYQSDKMFSIENKNDVTHEPSMKDNLDSKPGSFIKRQHTEVEIHGLGELLKFKYSWNYRLHHAFPQTILLYPVFSQNRRPDIRELMRYEIFRMCSFAYANHPEGLNMWFTQLAQAGFYYTHETRHISCFSCGCVCDATNAETIEMANQHECRRHERNIPLNEWTRGLNSSDLLPYYSIFGGLTPSFFELGLDHQVSNATNQLVPSIGSASGGQDVNSGFTEVVDVRENRLPSSYPDITEGSVSQSHQSLPTNLNEVSGSVVFQESDVSESREVLTSKSIEPVPFTHTPSQAATIPETTAEETNNAQNPPEEGAVGGHTASFELSGASYPQFASSSARRATFTGWNPDHPQRPDDLAAGGFFYAGYADCVRCFNCGLGLKYWRPSDIPAYQHARFRPNCVYNKMYKGQDYINKVQQDLQEEQARVQAAENNRPDNQVVTEFTDLSGPEQPPPPDPSPAPNEPDHEYLRLPAAQEALRVGWRADQVIQAVTNVVEEIGVMAQNLQQDMLFDVLRELYSADDVPASTGINNSRRDDSISSSSIADTSMATIRPRISADEPINTSDKLSSLAYTSESRATEENSAAGAFEVPDGSSREDPIEQYQAIVRENAYLNQRTICMICQMRPVGCVFLPCGHVIACQICALNERTCRACNKVIVGTSSVYLS